VPTAKRLILLKNEHFATHRFDAAVAALGPTQKALFESEDVKEGVQSFVERREAKFKGR
jgi:enoyl-CoA hydratase